MNSQRQFPNAAGQEFEIKSQILCYYVFTTMPNGKFNIDWVNIGLPHQAFKYVICRD